MLDQDGHHLGFTNYKASDGTLLTAAYDGFSSEAGAQEYFEKQIAKATKLVIQNDKRNADGKVVGKRTQIELRVDFQKSPAILWTDGATFHEIRSSSLQKILELEKVYEY